MIADRFNYFRKPAGDSTAAAELVLAETIDNERQESPSADSSRLLSIAEAAETLSVSASTVRDLASKS